ncbi:cytochrome c oxidase subunit II [Mucilaginibacter flavidus]|uniref:cytochrome c oxidase subunit II n=1 Tax=Mucilaginibacter flavidus TaxID=2949309 RepID=UPI002094018E|nr:cytochrome c oxidase subunit II [Mucilaginibacter flavidus]MCO5946474.1 cytochrome c oxidase subunit II [Mucilaginibacter flavidus]
MGFKHLINSKKTLSLFAAFVLFGTNLMAQTPAQGDAATVDKGAMWTGIAYYVLLFLVAAVCVAIVGKILRVYDLTQKMQGKKGINWNGVMGICCAIFIVAGIYGAYWSLTVQGAMKLPESASAHGGSIDDMFTTTTILTLIVFVITQICLFGFAFVYRGSDKRKAHFLPHNNTIEKVWTIIPAIVLTILVVFGFFTWQRVENSSQQKGDINIDVTGHQFAWEIRYPGADGELGSLNFRLTTAANKLGVDFKDRHSFDDLSADTLVVPVDKSIRLNIHAQDVIHSVYMPHFRLQQNAVPGLPTFFKFVPTITTAKMRMITGNANFEYLLYCNKICGSGHWNMQKVVRVVSQAEYQDWITKQKPYLSDQLRKELHVADSKPANQVSASNRLAVNN